MEPQHIIDACETNWEAHKADCSGFVKAVALALAVKTFSAGDNADAIVDRLRAASDWTLLFIRGAAPLPGSEPRQASS